VNLSFIGNDEGNYKIIGVFVKTPPNPPQLGGLLLSFLAGGVTN
jgi:hypothetical protein